MEYKKFIAIGDITVDDFIFLKDASVHCDSQKCSISMAWGEKIPFIDNKIVYSVGNSANAAVSAKRLGLPSEIITSVGDDEAGQKCIKILQKEGVGIGLIEKESERKTNYHYILSYESERTILVKHEKFQYKDQDFKDIPTCFYLTSMSEYSLPFQEKIIESIKKVKDRLLVFQPGTFQISTPFEKMRFIYEITDIFFCNREEAIKILKEKGEQVLENKDEEQMIDLLRKVNKLGPKIAVITDGPKGAYMYDKEKIWFMPPYPDPKPPVERTGAGDSFSSAFSSLVSRGLTTTEALIRAPINSMSVVQYVGAREGLLHTDKIEKLLKEAPADYKLREVI